jgi:hypothetical protein
LPDGAQIPFLLLFLCASAALRETDPYSTSEKLTQSREGAEEEAKGIG